MSVEASQLTRNSEDEDDPTRHEEAMAEEIVGEALHGYERLLSADAIELMRDMLVDELVCTPYGRRMLRASMPAPGRRSER